VVPFIPGKPSENRFSIFFLNDVAKYRIVFLAIDLDRNRFFQDIYNIALIVSIIDPLKVDFK